MLSFLLFYIFCKIIKGTKYSMGNNANIGCYFISILRIIFSAVKLPLAVRYFSIL